MSVPAIRPTKAKPSDAEPLENLAWKARTFFINARKPPINADRSKDLLRSAARTLFEIKQRVEAGEYAGSWEEFCAEHLPEFEPEQIATLIDVVDPNPRKPLVVAADKFLAWMTKHIAAPKHNHVVSVVWALASYYSKVVPVFPRLGYYAVMNSSGRTPAGKATAEVANFDDAARRIETLSYATAVRLANLTRKGVRLEDLHKYPQGHDIFRFMINSFPCDGTQGAANLRGQKDLIIYEIGGTPIIFTTNRERDLEDDVRRRCILLPMMRHKPPKRTTKDEQRAALQPIRAVFEKSALEWSDAGDDAPESGVELVNAELAQPMPAWMTEPQHDRWIALYAVARALLDDRWIKMLEAAAKHVESVMPKSTSVMATLLHDIKTVHANHPGTFGIVPGILYDKLRDLNKEEWGWWTNTRFGRHVHGIYDADGRPLKRKNIPLGAKVVGWSGAKGTQIYFWADFAAAWEAYAVDANQDE
jgi:hypothetical protein